LGVPPKNFGRVGDTHVVPEVVPINQGVKRSLAPNEDRKGKPRMRDLGLYGVETCQGADRVRICKVQSG